MLIGCLSEEEINLDDKVGSLKSILGTYPVLLLGLGDLNVVAFGAEQDKVDAPKNKTDIQALQQLGLMGKVVFLKSNGDLVMEEFSKVKQCLNEEVASEEDEEEEGEEDNKADEADAKEDAMAVDEEDGVAKEEQDDDSAVDSDDMEDSQSGPGEDDESDEEEEDEDISDDEEAKEALKLSVFQSILAQTGPKVKAVVINVCGKVVEKELDMTPKVDIVTKVLGGAATIVGQYKNGAVVMKLKDPKESMEHNEATLPAPFEKEAVQGKILLVRMDENAEPQDFTKEDYEDLCENGDEEVVKEELDLDASACQSIKDIARSIGSAHGAKIVEFYEKEIAAIQNESELKRIAMAIGQVHGKRIAEFLDKDSMSSEENETAILVDDLEEGDDEEDKDFDPKDAESVVSEADGDSDEASTDDERDVEMSDASKKFAAVLVKSDGTAEEHTIDIAQVSKLIGGSPTIVADYENGIVITKLFNPKPAENKLNMAQLPAPYEDLQILGSFVVMKRDKEGTPIDFTLKDYENFAVDTDDKEDEDYKDDDEQAEDDDEEEEESDSESESDEMMSEEEEAAAEENEAGGMLRQLFAMKGPIINAVHVLADGTLKDIEMDMSPKLNTPGKVLGGSLSIVGQYENGVVILKLREPASSAKANPAKLPRPFSAEQPKGALLLVKMDENAEPQSFTVAEFERQKILPSSEDLSKLGQIEGEKEAKCVIVRENGEIYDETMNLAEVKNVVGGEISCAGQYDDLSAVIKLKFPRPSTAKENAVVLPHPFHEESVMGCYAVVKLDKRLSEVTTEKISLVDYSIEDFAKLRSEREKFESMEDGDYEANSEDEAESSDEDSEDEKEREKVDKEKQQRAVVRKIIDKEYGELSEEKKEKLATDLIASYNGDQKFRGTQQGTTPSAKSATKQRKKRKSDVFYSSEHKKIRTDTGAIPEEQVMRTKSPGGSLRIQPAN